LGVRYRIIDQKTALLNEVPQGALVQEVIVGSPAEKDGVEEGDIITEMAGKKITGDDSSLAKEIANHKVGESVDVKIWRSGEFRTLRVTLEEAQ